MSKKKTLGEEKLIFAILVHRDYLVGTLHFLISQDLWHTPCEPDSGQATSWNVADNLLPLLFTGKWYQWTPNLGFSGVPTTCWSPHQDAWVQPVLAGCKPRTTGFHSTAHFLLPRTLTRCGRQPTPKVPKLQSFLSIFPGSLTQYHTGQGLDLGNLGI